MTSAVNRLRLSEVINTLDRRGQRLSELWEPVFRSLPVAPRPPFLLFLLCHSILDVGGGCQGDSQLLTSLRSSLRPPPPNHRNVRL